MKKSETKAGESMLQRLNASSDGVAPSTVSRRAEGLREFARSIGVSYDTCFRKSQSGELRTIRFGRRILVPGDEVARILQEGL